VTPIANVRTLVLTGLRGAGKTTLIRRLLGARPASERWAVIVNERGQSSIAPTEGVHVTEVDGGCMCCAAQLNLRVGLTRVLRESRPARLFIEVNGASHVADVLRILRGPWLAPVLRLDGVVHVVDAASFASRDDEAEAIDAADVVVMRGAPNAAAEAYLYGRTPRKRVLDAADLDPVRLLEPEASVETPQGGATRNEPR
jgi:G3E family GTPase